MNLVFCASNVAPDWTAHCSALGIWILLVFSSADGPTPVCGRSIVLKSKIDYNFILKNL